MTDETEEEKRKQIVDEYNARVSAGDPLVVWPMHEVVKIQTTREGEAVIDFVFAKFPDNRATVARLVVSKEAAQVLKAAFVANPNIPDTPMPRRDLRSTN